MSFRTKLRYYGKILGENLPPFAVIFAIVFFVMDLLNVEPLVLPGRNYRELSFAFLALAFLFWYFFNAGARIRKSISSMTKIVMPVLLIELIALTLNNIEIYKGLNLYVVIFFITTVVIFSASSKINETETEPKVISKTSDGTKRNIFNLLAIGIIILGVFLAARQSYVIPSLSVDEAHSSNAASTIFSRGFPYFPNTEVIYSRSWVDLYSIAISYKIFGFNEFAARAPSIVAFALTLFILFLILRRTVGKGTAILALFLFAINPWVIHYASYARMYIFLLLFGTLFSYLTILFFDNFRSESKWKWLIPFIFMPLTLIGGLLSERTFLIFAPPYAVFFLLALPRNRLFWKRIALYGFLPLAIIAGIVGYIYANAVRAFIVQYIIGFNNGADVFKYLQVQFIPVEWISYYGLPSILLIFSTVVLIIRGNKKERVLLSLFWFGEILIDVLIYSHFPERRFNYAFMIFTLYILVLVLGVSKSLKMISGRWRSYITYGLVIFVLALSGYNYLYAYSFPPYADFSAIGAIPPGSLVLGYPTSPMVFYNNKLERNDTIRPFITDEEEMSKYIENGTEIYSGGAYVVGVTPLNALRKNQDVYLMYEKTRFDFLNHRTKDFVFDNCTGIDATNQAVADDFRANDYDPTEDDYDNKNVMMVLKCPQLPPENPEDQTNPGIQ